MVSTTKAPINGKVLFWARQQSGYSLEELSKKIGVKKEKFLNWESGEVLPSLPQLKKISNVFKRPTSLFFFQDPPEEMSPPKDFRVLFEKGQQGISPKLRIEIRDCLRKRDLALEMAQDLEQPFVEFEYSLKSSDLEKEGLRFREIFGLTNKNQQEFQDSYGLFNHLRSKIESTGVLVFQSSLGEVDEFRGLSLFFPRAPIILLNTKDSVNARIFSLMHEFCHLLLRTSGICNFDDEIPVDELRIFEVQCNSFAGNFLVPKNLFDELSKTIEPKIVNTDRFAKKLKVSEEVILRRMLSFLIITDEQYKAKRKEIAKRIKKASKDGFVPPYIKSLSNNGVFFTSLIMNSLYGERIGVVEASDALGVKIKHFGKIEEELGKKILRLA